MSETVLRLVTKGDWACAFGERAALATVCGELRDVVEPALAAELAALARARDIDASTRRRWIELASSLRRRATSVSVESSHGSCS
jgi:hypothetical protein